MTKPKEQKEVAGSNGHKTLEGLADSVGRLEALVLQLTQNQQTMAQQLQPEEFAPDDGDLRGDAEEVAAALEKGEGGLKINPLGRENSKHRASEKLVDAIFDTPANKLDEMTEIRSPLDAFAYAGVRMFDDFITKSFDRKPNDKPLLLSSIFLDKMFGLNRSIGGKHLLRALAMSQIEKEREEAKDNQIIFGSGPED